MLLMPESLLGLAQFPPQLGETPATDVLELHAFQMLPNTLIGIQLGSVARKLFELGPFGSALGQKTLSRLCCGGWANPVPDHQKLTRDLSQKMPQECDHIRSLEGTFLLVHVELASPRLIPLMVERCS